MSKTIFRSNGFPLALAIMLLGSFFIITSCGGGGGGGGGGVSGITYDGLLTQATVSSTNANIIFSTIWNGGSSPGSAAFLKVSSTKDLQAGGMVTLFKHMRDVVSDATGFAARSNTIMGAQQVNETQYDGLGGRVTVTGDIDPYTFTGTLTMTFVNFNGGDGYTFDGAIQFRIDGFDMINGIITDGTMSFTLWRIRSANCDISLTGSIWVQESSYYKSETMTVNMDGRDNSTAETFRFRNFVETTVLDDINFPSTGTETISGQVFTRQYGYVDITTTNPLIYTTYSQGYPDSGGPIILTGEGGSKATITPISNLYVTIAVDVNGDGTDDDTANYAWSNLAGDPVVVP